MALNLSLTDQRHWQVTRLEAIAAVTGAYLITSDLLVYDNNICGDTGWILESADRLSVNEGKALVSDELNQVADAIFYARNP